MKCSKCKKQIVKTILDKIKGTFINGQPVCNNCQGDKNGKSK